MKEQVKKEIDTKGLVRSLYKDDSGKPFELSSTQHEIFDCIFKKRSPDGRRRIHIETYTQFGKSEVVSMAVLTRAATFPEKWAIIAPTRDKARIIMGYAIKHIFENEFTLQRFKIKEGENIDRIRRERSARRITFNVGKNQTGEIFILSAESKLKREEDIGNSLMGFGAPNLVMDEAALISDQSEAKAMRMVGGFTKIHEDFVVKIGNPFKRNHFLKAFEDPKYHNIVVNADKGIEEGRLTREFVEEMREKPYFKILYDCKFPEEGEIDDQGWSPLLMEDDIDRAMDKTGTTEHIGERRLGNDIARGGSNFTSWVLRSMNYAEILGKQQTSNLADVSARTLFLMEEHKVSPNNTFIDEIGVGGGVVDNIRYQQKPVRGVNVGSQALEHGRFANLRAEAYWRLREWIKRGGRLSNDDDWFELTGIPYKPDSKGRVRVMSKEEMKMRGIESPDIADALMLSFARAIHGDTEERQKRRKQKRIKHTFNRGALTVRSGGY